MTYEIRLAAPAFGSSAAPYATPISLRTSQRSGNGKSNFFAKAAFSSTVSKETPRISAFFFWYSA
jgi:hypothetical protein